jgi:hypothetical protein
VLDADGVLLQQKEQLGDGLEESVTALENASSEPSPCCSP